MKKIFFSSILLTFLFSSIMFAQVEELVNGGFEDGVEAPWELFLNNAATDATVDVDATGSMDGTNAAHITVNTTSSTATQWHHQYRQLMTVSNGATYDITYQARASQNVTIETWIQENHPDYLGFYQNQTVELTTTTQTFTASITADRDDDNVYMTFMFGAAPDGTEIWFDAVSIIETQPAEIPVPEGGVEFITNGYFDENDAGWYIEAQEGGAATLEIDSSGLMEGLKSAHVTVTNSTGTNWHVQLSQDLPDVTEGKMYHVQYQAKASEAVTIDHWIQQNHDPYNNIYSSSLALTTETQTFVDTGIVYETDGAKWAFVLGNVGNVEVWVDAVHIIEFDAPKVDTSKVPDVGVAGVEKIVNGTFENGEEPWNLELQGGAAATLMLDETNVIDGDYTAHVNITGNTGTNYHVQLAQSMDVFAGKKYYIAYRAKASAATTMETVLQQNHDPYTNMVSETVSLTTETQTFFHESDFMTVDDNAKFTFMMGLSGDVDIWIDDVTVIEFTPVEGLTIAIDAEKDAWYDGLTGPDDGMIYLPSRAFLTDINADGPTGGDDDISAIIWSGWDNDYFYYYAEVKDELILVNNAVTWQNDGIEIKYDPDPTVIGTTGNIQTRMTAYDEDDAQDPTGVDNINGDAGLLDTAGVSWEVTFDDYIRSEVTGGYVLEWRVATAYMNNGARQLAKNLGVGGTIGVGINVADNDNLAREDMLQWSAGMADAAWSNPQLLGSATFLTDNKIKYVAVNAQDPTVVNDSAGAWYYGSVVGIAPNTSSLPTSFSLEQNYPNPFNPSTIIKYNLNKKDKVSLTVYSVTGEAVRTLVASQVQNPGTYELTWDAKDNKGTSVSSGVYFYQIKQGANIATKKMILLR